MIDNDGGRRVNRTKTEHDAEPKPRLLFLCQNLPFPPDGGAHIRSFHTLRLLSEHFDIDGLFFIRKKLRPSHDEVQRSLEGLGRYCNPEAFEIPSDVSRLRLLRDHLFSVLSGRAYTRWTMDSAPMREAIASRLQKRSYALAHLDSLDLMAYLPLLSSMPLVVAHHNVESRLLSRRAESTKPLLASYIRFQALRVRREERRWCPRVSLNCVVSSDDATTLQEIAPEAQILVVPNGVDTKEFEPGPEPSSGGGIVFVGGESWFPNRDGMEFFVEEILPRLRARKPNVKVTWVGRTSTATQRALGQQGVHLTGYVDDIRDYVFPAECFVVPLRVGGGTRLKILDAWALGKPIVSTSIGAEGLEARHGENILNGDTPEAFADEIISVLESPELGRRLALEGRKTAERLYDWEVIGKRLGASYRRLIG